MNTHSGNRLPLGDAALIFFYSSPSDATNIHLSDFLGNSISSVLSLMKNQLESKGLIEMNRIRYGIYSPKITKKGHQRLIKIMGPLYYDHAFPSVVIRNEDCPNWGRCFELAVKMNWQAFCCRLCRLRTHSTEQKNV